MRPSATLGPESRGPSDAVLEPRGAKATRVIRRSRSLGTSEEKERHSVFLRKSGTRSVVAPRLRWKGPARQLSGSVKVWEVLARSRDELKGARSGYGAARAGPPRKEGG